MMDGVEPAQSLHTHSTPQFGSHSPFHGRGRDIPIPSSTQAPDRAGPVSNTNTHPNQTRKPRSQSRSPQRRVGLSPPGISGPSRSPAPSRALGPDGVTPFGSIPSRAVGVGLAPHIRNTYRHIKVEHEAVYRARGVVERTMDGWRGRGGDEKSKDRDVERGEGEKRRMNHCVEGRVKGKKKQAQRGAEKMARGEGMELSIRTHRSSEPAVPPKDGYRDAQMSTTDTGSVRSLIANYDAPPLLPPPIPVPLQIPAPSPGNQSSPDHLSLLSQIRTALKLRKVAPSQVNDKSTAAVAGHVYEATPHSKEVEARKRD